jgi:uncharacterized protein YbbC (DUF1343 family)
MVYAGTCYLEAMNISEGRGTDRPFETVGAPGLNGAQLWSAMTGLDLPGVRYSTVRFVPASSKFAGDSCSGISIHVTDLRKIDPLGLGLHLIRSLLSAGDSPLIIRETWLNRLMGTPAVLKMLRAGVDPESIRGTWKSDLQHFRQNSTQYILYSSR